MNTAKAMAAALALALALAASAALGGDFKVVKERPADFVEAAKVAPRLLLDMRYYTDHNFVGARVRGYLAPKCLLTKKAALALAEVQKELLAFGHSLKVYDCYRPQRAVDHFVDWAKDVNDTAAKQEFYPTLDKKNLFKDGYIAYHSSHTRGSTVDLTIVALPAAREETYLPNSKPRPCYLPGPLRFRDNSLDMGTAFDCFHTLSHTAASEIAAPGRVNRLLLKALMEKHGFVNYDKEWWHFTLKDEPYPETFFDFPVK